MIRRSFFRVLSFFLKEAFGVFRQPLLLISLIGGPALVLALFGVTFRSINPVLRAVLVWPQGGIPGLDQQLVEQMIEQNLDLVAVVHDADEGLQMLAANEADVVQIIPEGILQGFGSEEQPRIKIYSQTINPNVEVWLQSLTYVNTTYINQQILLEMAAQSQQDARAVEAELKNVQEVITRLESNLTPNRKEQALDAINTLQRVLPLPLVFLNSVYANSDGQNQQAYQLITEIRTLMDDLTQLEQAVNSNEIESQIGRIRRIDENAARLQDTIDTYAGLSPHDIVFPVQSDYTNLQGQVYKMVVFYIPGVLALLIQHLGIALGSLAVVRDRRHGAFELYRVSPVNAFHLILGKTSAYTLYVILIAGLLLLLLPLLGVPMLGALPLMLALILVLALASVGVGLLVSTVSRSDTQAIQLTMILLLFSIFFTGFFMPLGNFTWLARPISSVIPMTHGLSGLQALMLLGQPPEASVWIGLALISLVTYAGAYIGVRKMFR